MLINKYEYRSDCKKITNFAVVFIHNYKKEYKRGCYAKSLEFFNG